MSSAADAGDLTDTEERGGPNSTDVGKVPKGKEDLAAKLRPQIPGVWFGEDRFAIMFTCEKCGTRSARTVSKVSAGGLRSAHSRHASLRSRCASPRALLRSKRTTTGWW